MIIDQTIKVNIKSQKVKMYYESKGYKTQGKDHIVVSVYDLPHASKTKVLFKCDYCGQEGYTMYKTLYQNKVKGRLDACKQCKFLKRQDLVMQKRVEKVLEHNDDKYRIITTKSGKHIVIDADDYEKVIKYSWYIHSNGNVVAKDKSGRHILLHRYVMNCNDRRHVIHKDGNKLNNSKENLVVVDDMYAARKASPNQRKSKYHGVSFKKETGNWYARIKVDGKTIHLGTFSNEIACANCYNYYAKLYFGKNAKLNNAPYMSVEEWESYRRINPFKN